MGFITGSVTRVGSVVAAMDLVFFTHTPDFIMPVWVNKQIDIEVKDPDSGEVLFERTMPGPTQLGQVYTYGKVTDDEEGPYLLKSSGIKTFSGHSGGSTTSTKTCSPWTVMELAKNTGPSRPCPRSSRPMATMSLRPGASPSRPFRSRLGKSWFSVTGSNGIW